MVGVRGIAAMWIAGALLVVPAAAASGRSQGAPPADLPIASCPGGALEHRFATPSYDVWVCRAPDGSLTYEAARRSDGASIKLPIIAAPAGGYDAIDGDTRYHVDAEVLTVTDGNGVRQVEERVIEAGEVVIGTTSSGAVSTPSPGSTPSTEHRSEGADIVGVILIGGFVLLLFGVPIALFLIFVVGGYLLEGIRGKGIIDGF